MFFFSSDALPNQTVFRLDTAGVVTRVAGNGTPGFSGDNGPAPSAQVSNPEGVAVDAAGTLYIADNINNRIRKVSNGVITTVVGNGTQSLGDNGPATDAGLAAPFGVAVDAAGNLYIADTTPSSNSGGFERRHYHRGGKRYIGYHRRFQRRQRPCHQRPVELAFRHRGRRGR